MAKKGDAEKAIAEVMDRAVAIDANILYKQFIGLTNIERVGEEDFVLDQLMRGKSKNKIIEMLSAKYPDTKFNYDDIERFMARNQSVVEAMGHEVTLSARRHLDARKKCAEVLAGVALYTQNLIQDYNMEGDRTNTVAAIRALNTTLENYMKLEGMVGPSQEGGKVINIIETMSDGKSRLRDKIHNANFAEIKRDVTPKEDEE